MGNGLQIYNDSSTLQIDGTYQNLHLVKTVKYSTGVLTDIIPGVIPRNTWRFDKQPRKFSVSKAEMPIPIIAMDILNEVSSSLGGIVSNGDNWDIYLLSGKRDVSGSWPPPDPDDMNIYFFSVQVSPITTGVGLEVYNENGDIVFSSQNKPLVIKGKLAIPPDDPNKEALWEGDLTNRAILFQGVNAEWIFDMDVDEWYSDTFYGYQGNKIFNTEYYTSTDPNNHLQPALYAWFDHFSTNTRDHYAITAPLPLVIDTSMYK